MSMVWLILVWALLIRFMSLNQSLWWDEAINVVYAGTSSFWWFVTEYPIGDFHPPGYFAILWIWGHLFGFSELSVRLPSLIFGVLTIFITFLIGKELLGKKTGLLAALLLTVAPLHIYYSQEARMYSFAAFTATLATLFLIKFLKGKRWSRIGYLLSVGLLLYSDYLAYFILPVHLIWIILNDKKIFLSYILTLGGGIIFVLPWLLIFPEQLTGGQFTAFSLTGWQEVVGGAGIKEILLLPVKILTGRVSFDNNLAYILFSSALGFPFVFSLVKLLKSKFDLKISLLWLWLVFPPVVSFLISFFIPVFSYFRFIFILPAFYLLTAAGLLKFSTKLSNILATLLVVSALITSSLYLFNPEFHREDWKEAVSFVSKQNDESPVIFEYPEIPAPVRYYAKDLSSFQSGLSENLETALENKYKAFLFEYLADIYDPKRTVEKKLKNLNFVNTKVYNFRGIGFVKLYEK